MVIEEKYNMPTWKGHFLTDIAKKYKFKNYLELGIATGETWKNVQIENKVGVEYDPKWPKFENVIISSTDDYFLELDESVKFDMVFIDACHEKTQVKRDFLNSFNHLSDNGLIVMHDICPFTERNAMPNGANGDCYELWISLFDNYVENCATYAGLCPYHGEDFVGLFFKEDLKKIDDQIFDNMEYGYKFLCDNREKYIYSRVYECK